MRQPRQEKRKRKGRPPCRKGLYLSRIKEKTEEEAAPEPVTIKKHSINDEDWEKIAEQFKQDFGRELEEDGSMVFPSHEAAVNFFTEQAAKKLEFLAMQMQDNKPTGFAVFSCGDGQLYQGTIEEIKAAIEIANQENPQAMYTKALKTLSEIPSFNPASSMRGALDNLKKPDVEEAPGSGPAPK